MKRSFNMTMRLSETHCIVIKIPSSSPISPGFVCNSPTFSFYEDPVEKCQLEICASENSKIILRFLDPSENRSKNNFVYQVVSSILGKPGYGLHAFQKHKDDTDCITHREFFTLNTFLHIRKHGNPENIRLCFNVTRIPKSDSISILSRNQRKLMQLNKFAENENYTDIQFKVVGGKTISAHKIILAAENSRFQRLFNSDMKESKENIVEVPDFIKPEVMREMLHFIYTGNVKNLQPSIAAELFAAAHYYDVMDLQYLCKAHLISNISVSNLTVLMELADTYDLNDLNLHINKFRMENEAKIMKNQQFLDYLLSRISIRTIADSLTLIYDYGIESHKVPFKKFIKENIREVMRNQAYRDLYNTHIEVILEIDDFVNGISATVVKSENENSAKKRKYK